MYYFSWTLVIGFIVYLGLQIQFQLESYSSRTFNSLPLVRYAVVFPVVIGILLRLPKLIIEVKGKQLKSFDWIKFGAIGLPTFLVLLLLFVPYLPPIHGWRFISTIAGLVFGYVLLDSFKSKNIVDSTERFGGAGVHPEAQN